MRIERELMRGAGPVAVMQLLAKREMYGYEIADALAQRSDGVLDMGHSTLYPLLYNLEEKGLIASREAESESGRFRRYYALTAAGKKALAAQREQWRALGRAFRDLGILEPADANAG
jgi:PadR family transcriptional regulator, regulatory protein PadR